MHNAVIQYEQKPLLEQPLADFDSQYGSCVMQTVHMAKAFVPAMIKKGAGGRIVVINTECAALCEEGWFTFIKRLFSSSSLSAIRVLSSAYLRLLIFLPAILIPACASSSPAFLMMYSASKLNKQGDNI